MARFLLELHQDRLAEVPETGERISLVDIGSHCRGSLFVDGSAYNSVALEEKIDDISKAIPGYYFGRYDVKVPSIDHLMQAKGIKVIEANGLSSESTNIYDPKYSLFTAYRTLFDQWNMAFKISRQNKRAGARISSYKELLLAIAYMNR